jgi:hypothetical protein
VPESFSEDQAATFDQTALLRDIQQLASEQLTCVADDVTLRVSLLHAHSLSTTLLLAAPFPHNEAIHLTPEAAEAAAVATSSSSSVQRCASVDAALSQLETCVARVTQRQLPVLCIAWSHAAAWTRVALSAAIASIADDAADAAAAVVVVTTAATPAATAPAADTGTSTPTAAEASEIAAAADAAAAAAVTRADNDNRRTLQRAEHMLTFLDQLMSTVILPCSEVSMCVDAY